MPAIGWLLALVVAVGPLAAQTEIALAQAGRAEPIPTESAQTESDQTAVSGEISEAGDSATGDSATGDRAIARPGNTAAASQETWPFPETIADRAPEVSLASLLLKVGLGLSFVVGLAWGCVFLLKKSAVGQQFAPSASGIRVLQRSFLGPKRAIYLVEIGDRALALGVTESSINVLSRWPAGQLQLPERALASGGFAAHFRSLLKRGAGGEPTDSRQGASHPEVGE